MLHFSVNSIYFAHYLRLKAEIALELIEWDCIEDLK
jgi:hypothetical protein